MVDADVVAFQGAFNLLATTFRLYGTKSDKELVCDSYFKALRRFPLAVVVKAAEDLVAKHPARSFPLGSGLDRVDATTRGDARDLKACAC